MPKTGQPSWFLKMLLIGLGLAAYANSPAGEYCFDDTYLIRDNLAIEHLSNLPDLLSPRFGPQFGDLHYRPVAPLTFFVDSLVFGKSPAASRLINIALHIAIGLLLFHLWRILFGNHRLAFLAAALFLCHPITSEVVNSPGFRKDLLSTLLMLAALSLLAGGIMRRSVALGAAAGGVWFFALLSKEPAFMLILLAPMVFLPSPSIREGVAAIPTRRFLLGTGVVAGVFAIAFAGFLALYLSLSYQTPVQDPSGQSLTEYPASQSADSAASPWAGGRGPALGFLNFCRSFMVYIRLWAWPVGLSIGHPFEASPAYGDASLWLALGLFALFVGLSLIAYLQKPFGAPPTLRRMAGIGGLWIAICLVPVAQILPTPQLLAERFIYMAHAGMALMLAGLLEGLMRNLDRRPAGGRPLAYAFPAGILLILIGLTLWRNRDWRDDITLNIRKYEQWDTAESKLALGTLHYRKENRAEAAGYFQAAIEQDPAMADAYRNLGILHAQAGRPDAARALFEQALELDPEDPRNRQALDLLEENR